jgi:diadenosine tetraphosphatase ApaH/serine/threonine PP2A family protein phosphatase
MPNLSRVAVFGGVYSNHLSLQAVLDDAIAQGVDAIFCLGDIGGFGPHPNRAADLLRQSQVLCIQGNYDDSVGNALPDCQCGYSDPRDNHFARISYEYTLRNTSEENRAWMRTLPKQRRIQVGDREVLLAHGSPRRVNEFLWESMTPTSFIDRMLKEQGADLAMVTHSGIAWQRYVEDRPGRGLVNVGAIGRPSNNGKLSVSYALLDAAHPERAEFRRVSYDHEELARQMREEGLPEEFVETILSGWWSSCLEILPQKERSLGRY